MGLVPGCLGLGFGCGPVGSGDARAARRHAEDVKKLAPQEPLALLPAAQSAQLGGDRAGADRAFRQMAEHPHTKLLGLRGLFIEAHRNNDLQKASLYAEEAAKIAGRSLQEDGLIKVVQGVTSIQESCFC